VRSIQDHLIRGRVGAMRIPWSANSESFLAAPLISELDWGFNEEKSLSQYACLTRIDNHYPLSLADELQTLTLVVALSFPVKPSPPFCATVIVTLCWPTQPLHASLISYPYNASSHITLHIIPHPSLSLAFRFTVLDLLSPFHIHVTITPLFSL
jgi:hypothetical protein